MRVDGYVRVSRVGGRTGESFISPDEQRRAVEAYAAAQCLDVAEWHTDLDQSGGSLDRPAFQAALARCRSGETGGIIAAKLDRLTRSTVGLGTLIEEARAGGWNLIAVDFGLDLFSPNGKLVADVLAAVAEWERRRRGDDWATARRNAVERGIPNGRAPYGYRKRPDGRLEEVDRQAKRVREAFQRRAAGEPFASIGRSYGWSHSTTRQLLSNVAYLGVARSGSHINEGAHPAIVERDLFEAANAARTMQPIPPGDTTRDRLLVGLARCAGCDRTLKVVRRPRVDGSYVVSYYCKDAAGESCPDRAYVHADELDSYLETWFASALETVPRMVDVVAASRDLEQAHAEQAAAVAELRAFVETASALNAGLFQKGIDARQKRVDAAHELVRSLSARLTRLPSGGSLAALWEGFDRAERRGVLAGFLDRVTVSRGASSSLAGHVRIVWADGTVADEKQQVRVAAA